MKYRPEIDGLRALAVVPVILFHAGFSAFSGGYVGVDVFFVISGYLITTILIEDLQGGRFSIMHFYERRARRILPPLFFVMMCSLPFAWLWMFPEQLAAFARSLVAVSIYASNILFYAESGYFDAAVEEKPLIHTWSLAVEEQYYLVFPIVLLFLWRFGRLRVFWTIAAAAAASLLLSDWGSRNAPSANFYLAPSRAWELLAGSMTAFILQARDVRKNDLLAALGLAAIVFPIFAYNETTPFPGIYALVPVTGVVLVILFAESRTFVARILASPALVGIGLISYSAYLWHQPLFAFARIRSIHQPGDILMAALCVASFALAWFSWKFVEQPFRKSRNPFFARRSTVLAAGTAGLAIFAAIGLVGNAMHGFEARFGPDVLATLNSRHDKVRSHCNYKDGEIAKFPKSRCIDSVSPGDPTVMLLGDSHSMATSGAVVTRLNELGYNVYHASYYGCVPLEGFRSFGKGLDHQCSDFVSDAIDYARSVGIRTIVLSARFPFYYWGSPFNNKEGGVEFGRPVCVDEDRRSICHRYSRERRRRLLTLFEKRIRKLSEEFNIVLVAPTPEAGWNVPEYAAKRLLFQEASAGDASTSFKRYLERARPILKLFEKLDRETANIRLAPVYEALCSASSDRCANQIGNEILYIDDDHLSQAGAARVAPIIVDAVSSLRK